MATPIKHTGRIFLTNKFVGPDTDKTSYSNKDFIGLARNLDDNTMFDTFLSKQKSDFEIIL